MEFKSYSKLGISTTFKATTSKKVLALLDFSLFCSDELKALKAVLLIEEITKSLPLIGFGPDSDTNRIFYQVNSHTSIEDLLSEGEDLTSITGHIVMNGKTILYSSLPVGLFYVFASFYVYAKDYYTKSAPVLWMIERFFMEWCITEEEPRACKKLTANLNC